MIGISGVSATPFFQGISSVSQPRQTGPSDSIKQPFKAQIEPGVSPIRPALAPGLDEKRPVSSVSEDDTQQQESSTTSQESGQNQQLTEEEQAQVQEMKARDREVKAHERAHQAAGGEHAGAASYTYEEGPDGNRYAVGGEVPIDASPVAGDPQATIDKMRTVIRAALAPAEPSAQDQRVAQRAQSTMLEAQGELAKQRAEETKAQFSGEEGGESDIGIGKNGPQAKEAANSDTPSKRSADAYKKTQDYGVQFAFFGQIDPSTETNIVV